MKKVTFFLLLIFSIIISAQNNMEKTITINLLTSDLPKDAQVYIVGNTEQLGNWDPGAVVMTRQLDTLWSKTLKVQAGAALEFKFTLGSWDKEALRNDKTVPPNFYVTVSADTELTYSVKYWRSQRGSVSGQITGQVKYHKKMQGQGILARDVIVWLPPTYDTETSKRYPVLYMHDGQNIVDPVTSSMGVDWGVDETADSLIRIGKMREIIVVGINNTRDRFKDYSYTTDTGYAYMRFIVDTLKPFIDQNYRTLPDRKNTATMGSSMGGLISLMLVWEHNDVFSKAGCLSPAIKVHELNYIPYLTDYKGKKKDVKIYLDNGGLGLEAELQPGVEETIEVLKKMGYKQGKDFEVYFDKSAEHNERAWAQRLWRPLTFLFGL
ncbi:MAG: alpha/beta hydrolase-fold protein [Methanococcaceae archaeon]